MTITLAAVPVDPDQLDLLTCITDESTPLGSLHRADFQAACEAVADDDGWIDPNRVSAELHRRFGEINPRAYSAAWAGACGRHGFMDTHRDYRVPINGARSKGNGNKSVPMRKLRASR